jgi:hypothetical protein
MMNTVKINIAKKNTASDQKLSILLGILILKLCTKNRCIYLIHIKKQNKLVFYKIAILCYLREWHEADLNLILYNLDNIVNITTTKKIEI